VVKKGLDITFIHDSNCKARLQDPTYSFNCCCDIVREQLTLSQQKMKVKYDRKRKQAEDETKERKPQELTF